MPEIIALSKLRLRDCESEPSLGYILKHYLKKKIIHEGAGKMAQEL